MHSPLPSSRRPGRMRVPVSERYDHQSTTRVNDEDGRDDDDARPTIVAEENENKGCWVRTKDYDRHRANGAAARIKGEEEKEGALQNVANALEAESVNGQIK